MKNLTIVAIFVVVIVMVAIGVFAFVSYGSGTLEILATDPPSGWNSASQIYINYSSIEVHRADAGSDSGWFTASNTGGTINLTQILDVNQTIGSTNLQVGKYNLVRFSILQAIVTVGSANYTASVPSDKLQITITEGGVNINAGQTSKLLIELNISVQGSAQSGFIIVPDIRATPV